jgi:Na+/H+ antiporter NhaA
VGSHVSKYLASLNEPGPLTLKLDHALIPFVTSLVLTIFALANGGVELNVSIFDALVHPAVPGVFCGTFIGKPVAVLLFSWLAVRARIARFPVGISWSDIAGIGVLAGIGLTMSLFITSLAFVQPEFVEVAKVGILAGSIISGFVGWNLIRRSTAKTDLCSVKVELTLQQTGALDQGLKAGSCAIQPCATLSLACGKTYSMFRR